MLRESIWIRCTIHKMARFEKERKFTDVLYSRVGISVLLVVAILLSLSVISIFNKRAQARKQAKLAESRLHDLEVRKTELNADIAHLNTEAGKEEALRERYRQALPGEELIVIVGDDKEALSENVKLEDQDFFQKVSIFFKELF